MKAVNLFKRDWQHCPSSKYHTHKCTAGIVYIAQSTTDKYLYKVGMTKSMEQLPKRLKQINHEYGIQFRLVCFYAVSSCCRAFERWMQHRLKDYKVEHCDKRFKRKDELFRIPDINVRALMLSVDNFLYSPVARMYSTDSGIDFEKLAEFEINSPRVKSQV